MTNWIIEPRDPLIVRDGRPFGADPGARARSLGFPFPATTTGGLRHKAGMHKDGWFDLSQIDAVLRLGVRGPLLAQLDDSGEITQLLPPAPADALLMTVCDDKKHVDLRQLLPIQVNEDDTFSPAASVSHLVGPRIAVQAKPYDKPPRYWHWDVYERWLTNPTEDRHTPDDLGIAGPTSESRTHVGVDPKTQTAEDGRLFQTSGLEFTDHGVRLALVVESDTAFSHWSGGFAPLGGERRLAAWRSSACTISECPKEIRIQVIASSACRVVLMTPACFAQGFHPTWLLQGGPGVHVELHAAVVGRPQVISGWDMNAYNGVNKRGEDLPRGKPKATRRLAPAGSVYFLKLTGEEAAIDAWITTIWMQNISDAPQDRLDGFGLAALGTWDGKPITMEVQ